MKASLRHVLTFPPGPAREAAFRRYYATRMSEGPRDGRGRLLRRAGKRPA
jgi:hypothetical protein